MNNSRHSIPLSIIPRRKIMGISAILLPFTQDGAVDWAGFAAHVERTVRAGLIPAVNMDTGYVNLLDENTRKDVLSHTRNTIGKKGFVAGAHIKDASEDKWDLDAYCRQLEEIQSYGAVPVIFQSYGLINQDNGLIVSSYEALAEYTDQFIAFELGKAFAPFGKIYDIEVYSRIMAISQCVGAKHSSLNRELEWDRLELRNQQRADFKIFTGNDLAIDMVMYGSDYLLGLSSFAPDLFGYRDRLWEKGDSRFYQLNDLLQYLGFFAFRPPIPAYKHSAAQFLKLRNWIACDNAYPGSPTRPASDVVILRDIANRCEKWRELI